MTDTVNATVITGRRTNGSERFISNLRLACSLYRRHSTQMLERRELRALCHPDEPAVGLRGRRAHLRGCLFSPQQRPPWAGPPFLGGDLPYFPGFLQKKKTPFGRFL